MKNKRLLLLFTAFILVLVLSGCTSQDVYNEAIPREGNLFDKILVQPVAELLFYIGKFLGGSFAWGIIITGIIVRTVGWPIYSKSNDMSIKMQLANPEMDNVKKKYEGKTDQESQRKMQVETMEIYKKYGINPLGCLMPFLQMPIFIAMYQVVRRVPLTAKYVENGLDKMSFLGLDLAKGYLDLGDIAFFDKIGYLILPILVGALMYIQQKVAMKKPEYAQRSANTQQDAMQKQMKYMTYFFVIMMFYISLSNTALALYWTVGTAYSTFQTYINKKQGKKKYEQLSKKY